jgi:hypothetical protein
MYKGEDQKIYEAIRDVLHPQIVNKIKKIRLEYEVCSNFSFIKMVGIYSKKEELLKIYDMKEVNLDFEDEELIKIPLNLKKLREIVNFEKGQWNKCIYTLDKDKKINVDFIYPGDK